MIVTSESLGLLFTLMFGFAAIAYLFKKARENKKEANVIKFRTYHRLEWLRKRRMARLAQNMKKGKKL